VAPLSLLRHDRGNPLCLDINGKSIATTDSPDCQRLAIIDTAGTSGRKPGAEGQTG